MHRFSEHNWAKTALGSIDASEELRQLAAASPVA
jgi:hypothetical protein